jgi:hypothetical protein
MPTVYFDIKASSGFDLEPSDDLIAIRTHSKQSVNRTIGSVPAPESAGLKDGILVAAYPEAGVEVYRVPVADSSRTLDDRKAAVRASPDVRFAGGVLVDPQSNEPVLYTENFFLKFKDDIAPSDCISTIQETGLELKKEMDYAINAYFVAAPEGTGKKIFSIASNLLHRDDVEICHPELIRARSRKAISQEQWHLMKTGIDGAVIDAHASVKEAHQVSLGEGVTIAVIDDGFDIDHPEFSGADKIIAPRDATLDSSDPRPKDPGPGQAENHGTACAGVACANGSRGASGVAPRAKLLPIRLSSGLGSQAEADAFIWAVQNGADVISCSWGPRDGSWYDPGDPMHRRHAPLPGSTRLAIDYAVTWGRGGKGCVVFFAAGNGNESVENDGYASYEKVAAVAACNDRGTRSVYSDFGKSVWCAFPSNDFGYNPFNHPEPRTTGIWTTDRAGKQGYNHGASSHGDAGGLFTNSFGGTSSACPGAAGVAALVLSVNPHLNWQEVRDVLKNSCDKIDPDAANYDANGHSEKYGYGRINATRAVELAKALRLGDN